MSYDANGNVGLRAAADRSSAHLQADGRRTTSSGARSLGANWFIESGIPQSTAFRFSGFPVFPYGRNDLGRTPVLSQLDLNLIQDFRLPGRSRIQLQANIDNVLDQMTWTNYFLTTTQGRRRTATA